MNTKTRGNLGEDKACEYLKNNGFEIIERNWRTNGGEIDIISMKAETIVFVEVKTLPNGTMDMLSKELNQQKRNRILKTSKCFILNHRQYSNKYIRFDVIVIDMPGFPEVYHIENAFIE
ncbi:MAG: YraN family protein [Treponema sp.]|nr:YraN family protein [Treponema sp.]